MSASVHTGLVVPPLRPLNSTVLPDDNGGGHDRSTPSVTTCDHIDYNYDMLMTVICSCYIVIGVMYSLFGYRCFKLIMFLTGFTFAWIIVYQICLQEKLLPPYGNAGVALLAGFMFGLITMLIQYVGLFMMGLHTGLLIAVVGLGIADHILAEPNQSVWICIGVLLGTGLLFSIVNLHWKKGLTILGSCVYGGAITAIAVDYFVEHHRLGDWVWKRVSLQPPEPPPCWYSWLVLAVWLVCTLTGLVTQYAVTGLGTHHTESIGSRKKRRGQNIQRCRTREERAELRQKKYRYLYQVRTAHGDVISQSYVKSIQKKHENPGNGAGECSTLQSDATHLTILPDAQLAALTESEDDSHVDSVHHR